MSDDQQQQTSRPGGARPGAGRPRGARNRVPPQAEQYQQRFQALVDPEFDALVREQLRLAMHAQREGDRLKAIEGILNRLLGKPTETLDVVSNGERLTAQDIISAWSEAHR